MAWVVNLEIRAKRGNDPSMDDLVERHVLITTDDIEERERYVERILRHRRLGDFDDPEEEDEE